jgi:hypothetical protein
MTADDRDQRPPDDDEASTGLPGFRTWPAVYWTVAAVFVLWVVLLVWLTRSYT